MSQATSSEYEHDAALANLMAEPEIWVIRPAIRSWLSGRFKDLGSGSRFRDRSGRALPLLLRSGFYLSLTTDRTLFAWDTGNQCRSLGRLLEDPCVARIDLRGGGRGRLLDALDGKRQLDLSQRRKRLLDELVQQLGVQDRSVRERLERLLGLATVRVHLARRLFERHSPQRLVVATQHSVRIRAALVAAREAGVATVYVPHAPAAKNRAYRDLPFDFAALRGPLEVEYYTELGADTERLHVVGDLSLSVSADGPVCPDGPVVVAPSPWEPQHVERFMAMIDAGISEPFTVCPHPGTDLAQMRQLLPDRAHLVEQERTMDVIARGCRAVVQNSSGVAVEAMLLGAPVIEAPTNGRPPSYLAITEPYVKVATAPAELRQAVTALGSASRVGHAERARTWARGWTAYTGAEAEERLRALLASDLQPSGTLLDEWAPSVP